MSTSITYTVERSIPEPGVYRVQVTVNDATAMAEKIFVFATSTDEFSHVAKMFDILSYPEDVGGDDPFYRKNEVIRDFSYVVTANEFVQHVYNTVDKLVDAYQNSADEFPGTDVVTIPSS